MLDRLEKKIRKVIRSYHESRFVPPDQPALVEELRQAFASLPPLPERGATGPEEAWLQNMRRLRTLVRDHDPMEFLRWDVIKGTMFVRDSAYIEDELAFLRGLSEWEGRWQPAVAETSVGRPQLSWRYPRSSGNLLHNAYHLARFEQECGGKVTDGSTVLEFGGGYGSMCRLFQNLGFQGRYLIFDLPEFSLLQRFFLRAQGFEVHSAKTFAEARSGIACISDIAELVGLLQDCFEPPNSMFIATWSLSEAPLELRARILPLLAGFGKLLIAYQGNFEGVDNAEFFTKNFVDNREGFSQRHEIKHLPGNFYLFKNITDLRR